MSFLAPLYFVGAAAVLGPIIFHLIRRQPKGEIEFSSLMFLEPTPPRLTRRSRLENLPLLLLRCLAILLLAFAFARPFFPSTEETSPLAEREALVLLVDCSASMRREGVWDKLIARSKELIEDADAETLISVVSFGASPKTELSLAESFELASADRKAAATSILEQLQPEWAATNIGIAIRYAADQSTSLFLPSEIDTATDASKPDATIETRVVLLSDLANGAETQSLQGYQWPNKVWLELESIRPSSVGNASLRVVGSHADLDQAITTRNPFVRVQVSHLEDTGNSVFALRFAGSDEDAAVVQVPAGETRIVKLDLPGEGPLPKRIDLFGDPEPFDNATYFVAPQRLSQRVVLIGPPPATDRREDPVFYANQIPFSNPTRDVAVVKDGRWSSLSSLSPEEAPLVIAFEPPPDGASVDACTTFCRAGGRMLIVLDQSSSGHDFAPLARLIGSDSLDVTEAGKGDYALIESVDFRDSIIVPLAEPGFNDFSNIRIWKHRVVHGLGRHVQSILKLDDGSPLLASRTFDPKGDEDLPPGALWVLTSGWQLSESQFVLSTKFVPMMLGMFGAMDQSEMDSLEIGEEISAGRVADRPGVFDRDGRPIAVNLNWSESETKQMDVDRFKQFGAPLSSVQSRELAARAERALRDVELEARQGWWQWLIVATIGLVGIETWFSAFAPGAKESK